MDAKNNDTLEEDFSILVQSDKLKLLYQQSFTAIFVSILTAAILVVTLWPAQRHTLLIDWFSVLFITALLRLYLFARYRKAAPEGQSILSWEQPYLTTLMLTSLTWGIGGLIIMPADSLVHQAVVYSFLLGMSGGAISLYSSHASITIATITAILFPVTGYFLLSGNHTFVVMAVGGIIFYFSAIRSIRFLGKTLHQNFKLTHQLEFSNENAERIAHIDDLTGLYNRRAFYQFGNVLVNNCQRNDDALSMIHMDIDHFKKINDTYGHAAGDTVLKQIGQILQHRLRKSDVFARIGGEEFGMLLPMTPLEQAAQLAEELRQEIEQYPISYGSENLAITASFGVSSGIYEIDGLIRESDALMYRSKHTGRNKVTY